MSDFQKRYEQARDKEFWLQLNPNLHITDEAKPISTEPIVIDPLLLEEVKDSLKAEGYFQVNKLLDPTLTSKLATAVENIFKAGWPTPFAIVYDEYWELFYRLKRLFEAILGEEYKQVPNFWCWYIDTNQDSKGWGHHRDRPSVNTVLESGLPATLTTWIPLTNATPANGCIYIVPSTRDPNYPPGDLDKRDLHELQNIRALPAAEGDVLGWTEALLHWGSRSSHKATNPRVSISFTFQRADQNPYEVPLFEPSRYQLFNERLGLIAQNVCNYQAQGPTTPEILFACRRLSGLIPTISIQDGAVRQTLESDKRLSDCMIWKMQEKYFERERAKVWTGDTFYSTNRMPFVESYVELVTSALLDCATLCEQDQPLYILELGGGSGCFAYRFLNDLAENIQDYESLKKLNIKYILTDFSELIVKEWLENKNLNAKVEQGILEFGVFNPLHDQKIELMVSGQSLTAKEIKNPLIVIANHVFDSIEQDAFRVTYGVLQESKVSLFRENRDGSFDQEPTLDDLRITERFVDVVGPYYQNSAFDDILQSYKNDLVEASMTFPIGALRCIENLSNFCGEKLILLSADTGYVRLDSERIAGLKKLDFDRHGAVSFDLNFAAISKYFLDNGGTSLVENSDFSGLRVAFNSLLQNRFQNTTHYFKHYLQKKNILDSQLQINDLIKNGLRAGDYESSRVSLFLSIVRAFNYDPAMFAIAHKDLLDERFKDLEEMNTQVRSELQETLHRTIKNIYIVDDNHKIFDSILRLYIQLDWFEECLKFSEEIIQTYGEISTAVDHAALSCEALKMHQKAYEYFQRATNLPSSDYEWATAGVKRSAKFLMKEGDTIVRFTIARAK
ncbi:MAG: SAM-dependent methyltransferase [Candidatus Melainabacteria bacterium]|nr:SAM-dependent methyltransferase [Candidatus Melainabacteria bacterium]